LNRFLAVLPELNRTKYTLFYGSSSQLICFSRLFAGVKKLSMAKAMTATPLEFAND